MVPKVHRVARAVGFGVFQVDLQARELRKHGIRIKLQNQPFEVLAMLLERPGEIVTREELYERLWPDQTFVDFERNLNAIVKKLRAALADTAETPRFIETLARRGYRFIAPVVSEPGATNQDQRPRFQVQDLPPEMSGPGPGGRRRVRVLSVVAIVAIALGASALFWPRGSHSATPDTVLTAAPLTTYFGQQGGPTFSPDGSQVAFSWNGEKEGNSNIYVKVIGSEAPLRLTTNVADEYSPAWSPDGRWIAFCRALPGGKYAVVLTSPIPGPERVITERYGGIQGLVGPFLAWSPDSRWLAMAGADGPGVQQSLFLYSLETGEKRRITSRPIGDWQGDSCPAFSPDGRKLAFSRWTAWASSELYLLDLSPDLKPVAEPKRVTAGNWEAASPAWTADGRSLIFSANSGSEISLWRMDATGSGKPTRLAALGGDAVWPAISRGGNRLAFVRFTLHTDIWRMEIPTPGVKAKSPKRFIASTRNHSFPEFSPDGRKIAFLSDRSGTWEVWICDADGSNLVQLTSWGKLINSGISWSPDSRRLAFSANVEGHSEVYVLNISGGSPQRRTFTTYAANPSWSNDGHWIFFDSTLNNGGIYKVPADGGPAVLVTHAGGWAPVESPDGKFIYTMVEAGLVRVPTAGGQEQFVANPKAAFNFALLDGGIYFIPNREPGSDYSIQFLNTITGKTRRIAALENEPWAPTISPDGRWMLYFQIDQGHSNLMLIENFR